MPSVSTLHRLPPSHLPFPPLTFSHFILFLLLPSPKVLSVTLHTLPCLAQALKSILLATSPSLVSASRSGRHPSQYPTLPLPQSHSKSTNLLFAAHPSRQIVAATPSLLSRSLRPLLEPGPLLRSTCFCRRHHEIRFTGFFCRTLH